MRFSPALSRVLTTAGPGEAPATNPLPATAVTTKPVAVLRARMTVPSEATALAWASNCAGVALVRATLEARAWSGAPDGGDERRNEFGRLGGVALEQGLVLTGHAAVGQDEAQDGGGGHHHGDSNRHGRGPPTTPLHLPSPHILDLVSCALRFSTWPPARQRCLVGFSTSMTRKASMDAQKRS